MIIHFDGDAFFASVEQTKDYRLQGKPVVVGQERGAPTSVSYEAKKFGISRGVPMKEIRKLCPHVAIVPSDYAAYSVYSDRMYAIARRFTDRVEEYSIDECFADITGLDTEYGMTYEEIALAMKKALEQELGLTFGVGLAPNKVLAKIASKWRKPSGFTVIKNETIIDFLKELQIGAVWGIGSATSIHLSGLGIRTALDFASKDSRWLDVHKISKPYREIHAELNGKNVKEMGESREDIKSIIKSRTFRPPTNDKAFLLSELSKNCEEACDKVRRHGMVPRFISFYLKTQEFSYHNFEFTLPVPTASASPIISLIRQFLDTVHRPKVLYRATGIALRGLVPPQQVGNDLFGEHERSKKNDSVVSQVDRLNHRYGSHTVFLASSLAAFGRERTRHSKKEETFASGLLPQPHTGKRLSIPFLGHIKV